MVGAALVLPHEHRRDRARVGVDRHDRRVLRAHTERHDVARNVGMRRGQLVHRIDERGPQRVGVLFGDVAGPGRREVAVRARNEGAVVGHERDLHVGRPDVDPDCGGHRRIVPGRAGRPPGIVRGPNHSVSFLSWTTPTSPARPAPWPWRPAGSSAPPVRATSRWPSSGCWPWSRGATSGRRCSRRASRWPSPRSPPLSTVSSSAGSSSATRSPATAVRSGSR